MTEAVNFGIPLPIERRCRYCAVPLVKRHRLGRWPIQCDACRPVKQRWYRGPRLKRTCAVCRTPFTTGRPRQRYCKQACQWAASRQRPATRAREALRSAARSRLRRAVADST